MNVFSPGVFGPSKKAKYHTCSITKGTQRNWANEKEPGNTVFTAVGTYTGGELLVENDTGTKAGTPEAIDALRHSGNLPTVSPKSQNASMLSIALRFSPSLTGYIVEWMLPRSTRPVFCRLLREQSGVSAIRDGDLPRVAVRKMCEARQRATVKQTHTTTSQSHTTNKNTKNNKKTRKTSSGQVSLPPTTKHRTFATILLQTLGTLTLAGYGITVTHLYRENEKQLQALLGGAITSFEKQYKLNCVIHAMNNGTYWYRKTHGMKQISQIDVDVNIARLEVLQDSTWWSQPSSLMNRGYMMYFTVVAYLGMYRGLKVSSPIDKYQLFASWLTPSSKNSFKPIAILLETRVKSATGVVQQIRHAVSLRYEPDGSWLYQDSESSLQQHRIYGKGEGLCKLLWRFMHNIPQYSGRLSNVSLVFNCCYVVCEPAKA